MSTIYQIEGEAATTVSATDSFLLYKTSTGRTMRALASSLRTYAIGSATTDTLGFFGATATALPTSTLEAVVTNSAAVSVSATIWAYTTSTQADGIVRLVNRLRADLVSLGLITGA